LLKAATGQEKHNPTYQQVEMIGEESPEHQNHSHQGESDVVLNDKRRDHLNAPSPFWEDEQQTQGEEETLDENQW
jgi:hypothetical protein